MAVDTLYLIDKSALARWSKPEVGPVIEQLLEARLAATCCVIDMEILYSAQSRAEYRALRQRRRKQYASLPVIPSVTDRAETVLDALAERSQHRGAGANDLLIAACAEMHGAVVLHYDADYEVIASVTGQQTQWVAPRGSIT